MPDHERTLELVQQAFEQTTAARRRFEELDNEANAAAASLLQTAADLAKRKPDEFFGLKPTERQVYIVENVLLPLIEAQRGAGDMATGEAEDVEDITGSMPAPVVGAFARALGAALLEKGIQVGSDLIGDVISDFFGGKKGDGSTESGGGGGGIGSELVKGGFELFKEEKQYWLGMDKQTGDRAEATRQRGQ
jgi:hypothetical protein